MQLSVVPLCVVHDQVCIRHVFALHHDRAYVSEQSILGRKETRSMSFSEGNGGDVMMVTDSVLSWDIEQALEMIARENYLKGMREAKLDMSQGVVVKMLKMGDSVEKVAACCDLSEEEVRSIQEAILASM
jgi:hypothetical protein